MLKKIDKLLFLVSFIPLFSFAKVDLKKLCETELSNLPGKINTSELSEACTHSSILNQCYAEVSGKAIFHFDKFGRNSSGKRILVFALFHGDEAPAGSVARYWMERLTRINPRSTWRVVPIVNPDGLKGKTRTNGRGVDLNRNLPTQMWDQLALENWKIKEKKRKRRFPGEKSNSEQETKCVLNHLENFKPDFVVSIHTPYGILDFDGPRERVKPVIGLPSKSLGHFPGSLGRYMWAERKTPVLTVELKGNKFDLTNSDLDKLQDQIGSLSLKL